MDKCFECGLERSSHTQLPHRFKDIPPNPDQGVLFDTDMFGKQNIQSFIISPTGEALPARIRLINPVELDQADWDRKYLTNAATQIQETYKIQINTVDIPHDLIDLMIKYSATNPAQSRTIMRKLQDNAEAEAAGIFVPKSRRLQAKHIPDERIITVIDQFTKDRYTAMTPEIYATWPHVPRKVILAKLDKMVHRKILDGCACGCSGQFRVINGSSRRCLTCKVQEKDHTLKSPHHEFYFPE